MTPTNLPVQPATAATPTQGSVATATEQSQTTDFLAMLGQLVAASVQRSGTSVAPTTKVPAMFLDGDAKKDEVDPEQLLAMFSMAAPPQVPPINIDVPVGQALQALSGVSISAATAEGPVQNILQEVAKQITDAKEADARRKRAVEERRRAYVDIFELYAREQAVLERLYKPLEDQLARSDTEQQRRLAFYVRRHVNLDAWVERGENLLDLRRSGAFQGRGRLFEVAKGALNAEKRSQ